MIGKILVASLIAFSGILVLRLNAAEPNAAAEPKAGSEGGRYFEMRTYHANEGKMKALNARFRDYTHRLFLKHGMDVIGYWEPVNQKNTLTYILAYPSKEARETCWNAFQNDPEWKKAKAESERDGALVSKVDQVFMTPTDYSPLK